MIVAERRLNGEAACLLRGQRMEGPRPAPRRLKVIVANPIMIKAYKSGIPGNGQRFPEGSQIAKLQWSFKKSTEAPFVVDVPDAPTQAFLIATATTYVCADAKTTRPLGDYTAFEIGSIAKTMTAALLAEMVARGDTAWSDPVERVGTSPADSKGPVRQ